MSQPDEFPAPPLPAHPVRPSDYLRMPDEAGEEREESEKGKEAVVDIVDQEQQEALVGTSVLLCYGCSVGENLGLQLSREGERLVERLWGVEG